MYTNRLLSSNNWRTQSEEWILIAELFLFHVSLNQTCDCGSTQLTQVIISQPSVTLLTLVPEFSFLLLELSAQSLISITVWIMNDRRALYKGCYSCTVLLNRKLFCMPSWSKRVADCLKSFHYLGYCLVYIIKLFTAVCSRKEGSWHPYRMAHLLLQCYWALMNIECKQQPNSIKVFQNTKCCFHMNPKYKIKNTAMFAAVWQTVVWYLFLLTTHENTVIPTGEHMNKFQTKHFSLLVVSCRVHFRLRAQLGTFATFPA